MSFPPQCTNPVSYTHLDVYKRQGLNFGLPATRRLRNHWRQARPDAIYVATEGPLGWSALRAARQLEIPVATGFHTRFDDYVRSYGAAWLQGTALRWMRHFHNGAQATLVPTRELQTFLENARFHNVVQLPRAVDTQAFHPNQRDPRLRARWGLGDDALAVIYVGRIAPEKNLALAVRAFRQLQRLRPQARFVWVGDGPARAALQRENPDFIFCGIQPVSYTHLDVYKRQLPAHALAARPRCLLGR